MASVIKRPETVNVWKLLLAANAILVYTPNMEPSVTRNALLAVQTVHVTEPMGLANALIGSTGKYVTVVDVGCMVSSVNTSAHTDVWEVFVERRTVLVSVSQGLWARRVTDVK